jgi:3-methyladenine DNA glycosylase AlkC
MSTGFLLKDHLFNPGSVAELAAEYGARVAGFDADGFVAECVPSLAGKELLERLDWIADCVEARLATTFAEMADQLEAAMPVALDPSKQDDDFGRFIHAVPGILAVRHGLELHRDRALDLLHAATKRFSMEFYIRPFVNRWPKETLARLQIWANDENYHVRRLVSEGLRPRLPWAKSITLDPMAPMSYLDHLHADPTRYVTRSVANHLNDIAKFDPGRVVATLEDWRVQARQDDKELTWMTRHALRTLVKLGDPKALALLGYDADAQVTLTSMTLCPQNPAIGEVMTLEAELCADALTPVVVDYVIWFRKSDGSEAPKVFKIKQAEIAPGRPLTLTKKHRFKGDATTFRLYPGAHRLALQVNGRQLKSIAFDLRP